MSLVIYDLLQSKSIKCVVKDFITFSKNNDRDIVNKNVMQFFIHLLNRSYELTEKDIEEFGDITCSMRILFDIYESVPHDEGPALMIDTAKTFIENALDELFLYNLLHSNLVNNWIRFFEMIIENKEILDASLFKCQAIHIFSLLLAPLCRIQKILFTEKDDLDISNEFTPAITKAIDDIMLGLHKGFNYKNICISVATQFINVMESNNELFITHGSDYLHNYIKMLCRENNMMNTMALKSLWKHCYNSKIREPLIEFLFRGEADPGDYEDRFLEILQDLFGHRHLKVDIMSLLNAMIDLRGNSEFLSEEMRFELYLNVFSGSKKIISGAVDIMTAVDDDFWLVVIKMLNSQVTEEVELSAFIKSLLSIKDVNCDPKVMSEIVLNNVNIQPATSQRAAVLLVELLKNADDEQKQAMLENLDEVINNCLDDERTFILLLDCITADFQMTLKVFKDSPIKFTSTVISLTTAFKKYESYVPLYNIITMLKQLTPFSSSYVVIVMRSIFNELYLKYLDVFHKAEEDHERSEEENLSLTKLAILLENRSWNIIQPKHMELMFKLNQKLISSPEDPLCPIAIRLHCNFIKHLWFRLQLERPLPFDNEYLAKEIESFIFMMGKMLSEEPFDRFHYVLCSFMDMCICFQPIMSTRHKHEVFKLLKFELRKETFRELASVVEANVFLNGNVKVDVDDKFIRSIILQSWIVFCHEYDKPASITASHKIISHYKIKCPFKADLEILMKQMMAHENMFEHTVAMTTLDLSNHDDSTVFRSFFHALEDFLRSEFINDIAKRSSILIAICSFVLPKIAKTVEMNNKNENEDRLKVLEFVTLMLKNLNVTLKRKLERTVPSLAKFDLTEGEKKHLTTFLAFLQQ